MFKQITKTGYLIRGVRWLAIATLSLSSMACSAADSDGTGKAAEKPNIIVVLADDMGFGDIGAYNADSKIPTPHLDQMAAEGMRFTDAHTPSSVCTPTRYSLLTGRYAWRSRLKSGVLWGYSPLLIETDRETVPSLLKKAGYATAGIGKWHLGMGDSEADYYGASATSGKNSGDDFGRLSPGPNEVGFDYFFGIPASLDMKPYVYVENGAPASPLTGRLIEASGQRRFGGGGFWRKGQIGEGFVHEEVMPVLTDKAVGYVRQQASSGQPFFLYFALTAPHTPWLPTKEFQGVSGAGHYGDFSAQVDATMGQLFKALKEEGIADNTLIIFTSDNGAHWLDTDIEQYGHLANGQLRGQKADIHEGGHRVPFIARWPGRIASASVSEQPMTLADLMATFATIADVALEGDAGPDSFDISASLLDGKVADVRNAPMVHHALDGMFAIRDGDWKLIEGLGSGGFTEPTREQPAAGASAYQLYNLASDPLEKNNVAKKHPEVVKKMSSALAAIRDGGRSRP
ncbi:sulfatase family protein [Porticoccus sp. GXU_MW_L64]